MDFTYILLGIVLVLFIGFQFWNSRRRRKQEEEKKSSIVPGVEIMTNYGLFGTLVSVDEANNWAFIEVAPGQVLKVHRSTILKAADPAVAAEPDTDDDVQQLASEPSVELNADHAIQAEPQFGERIEESPKRPARRTSNTTKKTEE